MMMMMMMMMMLMSENLTMPVIGPCNMFQGSEEPLLTTQFLLVNHDHQKGWVGVVLTIHQPGKKGGDRIRTVNMILWAGAAQFHPHILHQGFQKQYNYFVTGQDK